MSNICYCYLFKLQSSFTIWDTFKVLYGCINSKEITLVICTKEENILKSSLDWTLLPSPSVKLQIMGGEDCLRRKGKTLLDIVNKLLKTKKMLTSPSNFLPY